MRVGGLLLLTIILLSMIVVPSTVPAHAQEEGTQPVNPPTNQTTTTSTNETNTTAPPSNETNQTSETPTIYSNTIHFTEGERFIGVCYPWVVFTHNFLDLSSWTFTPGIGGDTAISVSCGDDYFIVEGISGVYVVSRSTGRIVEGIPLQNMEYIGYAKGLLAFKTITDNVIVHTPFQGDMYIPLQVGVNQTIVNIKFGVVSGVPFVAYIIASNNTVTLKYSTQTKTVNITTLPPTSTGLYVYDKYIIVENDGIEVYRVDEPSTPIITKLSQYTIYLPLDIEDFVRGNLNELYLYTVDGSIIKVDIIDRSWDFLGQGVITKVGIFVYNDVDPQLSTTYVPIQGTIYPIPGEAIARIGNLVFTNIIVGAGENGTITTVPVLWSAVKSVVISKEEINGILQVTDDNGEVKTIRLSLPPGIYMLPRDSTIVTDLGAIKIDKPEVYYPPVMQNAPIISTSLVKYSVTDFPSSYQSMDTFENVKYVASGGNKLLIILPDRAVVYAPYGVVTVIPGVWEWGGISNYIVLYDGASFRVFDLAGNPLASYSAFIVNQPIYVSVVKTTRGFDVHLYLDRQHIVVNETGVYNIPDYPAPRMEDMVSGLRVTLYAHPEVKYGEFVYHIPYADNVEINMYTASWTYEDKWYILDIPNGTVYVFMNAPTGVIYPLDNYLGFLENNTLMILPYKAWIVSGCYVDINAPSFADIYINNKYIGQGSMRYYTSCGKLLNITATAEYHKPDSKMVVVNPGGVNVTLSPEPRISFVTLQVISPENLPVNAIVAEVDNKTIVWYNNDVHQFIAGKPYNIRIVSFQPYDVCEHPSFANVIFQEGNDTFTVHCQITGSVLGVKSDVPTLVSISTETGEPVTTIQLQPGSPAFIQIDPGTYIIKSKPIVEGYVERELNVTVPEKEIVVVDVTPYPYSKIIISAIPEIADIQVMDMNGTVIGEGTGNLTVEVLPGQYQIIATAPGYQQYFEVVNVTAGESKIVNITMIPQPTQTQPPPKPFWQKTPFQLATIGAVVAAVIFALWWRKRREASEVGEVGEVPIETEGGGGG